MAVPHLTNCGPMLMLAANVNTISCGANFAAILANPSVILLYCNFWRHFFLFVRRTGVRYRIIPPHDTHSVALVSLNCFIFY